MILTHFLAFMVPPVLLLPGPGLLPMADSGSAVAGNRADPALLPALKVRAAPTLLVVRGD